MAPRLRSTAARRTAHAEIAIFGGSFDPPHAAHVLAAVYARKMLGVARVLVVPVYEHAFGKPLTPFAHRVQMCRLAFSGLAGVHVSQVEARLPKPNYTLRLVQHLSGRYPAHRLRLLIGADVLEHTERWFAFEQIAELSPPLVLPRPGYRAPQPSTLLLPDVSSSAVREALASERSSAWLASVLPEAVREYINAKRLYRSAPSRNLESQRRPPTRARGRTGRSSTR